jgi:DNA polymerase-3 subunit delta'
MLAELASHPHARAVLGAALDPARRPSHAYLLHGPAGSGKRAAARAVAAELLARDAPDPANARIRVEHGAHPDLSWVTPSGAHEMLRRDVDAAIVAAATQTPFEAGFRIFVLERADTMNDEAANALLKTLEEPPPHVVLLLLTDRPGHVLATIASRCQPVRFDAPSAQELAGRLAGKGIDPATADACARLALGDGDRALALALGTGPRLRADAEAYARAPIQGRLADRPWTALLRTAQQAGAARREAVEAQLASELELLPRKDHARARREADERARRAERRAATAALDHALQLAGLWYRDVACVALEAPELAHHSDRLEVLAEDAALLDPVAGQAAIALVEDARAALQLNVGEELALEALAYRLAERLAG